ncbi:pseudouridine-5'-phosphatase-like [Dermacentor albipictus]|uniref:pseudouridine-5'-phosphatase-like n=1 Tax=Dermacentor albipictus TaxID=60249 RepID=UPI0038FC1D45
MPFLPAEEMKQAASSQQSEAKSANIFQNHEIQIDPAAATGFTFVLPVASTKAFLKREIRVLTSPRLLQAVLRHDGYVPAWVISKDTKRLYTGAAERVASQYGKQLTSELKRWLLGTPDTDTALRVVEYLGLPITPDGFMEAMEPICEEVLPTAELMPGADRIARHLHAHGIPMAVTTISKRPSFELKITRHQDLLTLFHHMVCSGGDPGVNHGMPQPDIFLVAASRFDKKALPEKVLVFENSPMGVEAALTADMQVLMVAEHRVDEENPRHATLRLTSLLEFKPELFGLPSFPDSPKRTEALE